MKLSNVIFGIVTISLVDAYPGMKNVVREIQHKAFEAQNMLSARADNIDDGDTPPELIGDIKDGGSTPVGKSIANILMRTESAESNAASYTPPGALRSAKCQKDTCCAWSYVAGTMSDAFRGPTGRCNKLARAAIRLGFHDAGTWSKRLAANGQDFGGADGSIALAPGEIGRAENRGLQDIVTKMLAWQQKFGVGMADLIQFGAIVAVVSRSSKPLSFNTVINKHLRLPIRTPYPRLRRPQRQL